MGSLSAAAADTLSLVRAQIFSDGVRTGSKHLHIQGTAGSFSRVFTWNNLSTVLNTQRLTYPQLRLVRQGTTVAPAEYLETLSGRRGTVYQRPDPTRIMQLMANGAMLHLAALDEIDLGVSDIACLFEGDVQSACFVNLHAGLHESRGFNVHWDGHEVCVIQVSGRKLWRVYDQPVIAPLTVPPSGKGQGPTKPVWEEMLEEGDCLYLPRGMWHSAEAVDGPSLHLSVGWEYPTGNEFCRWMLEELRGELRFRSDAPVGEGRDQVDCYVSGLKEALAARLTVETYDRFTRSRLDGFRHRRRKLSLP